MNLKDITLKGEGYNSIKIPIRLFGNAKIIKKAEKDNKRIISGYANLAVVDSQNQLIPTEVLKAGIETLMTDLSYANLMLFHKNIQIGKILPEYGELKTHVDDRGLYIIAEIRQDTEIANEIWQQILDGNINGFSIGCEVIDSHDKCDLKGENCIEVLDEINIFEVSLTNFPANEMSGFVVISKSKYDEGIDLDNYLNVCDKCGIEKDIMTKKKVKSEVTEEETTSETEDETKSEEGSTTEEATTEEEQKSVEDRIESMERSIFNIEATIEKLSELIKPEEEEKQEEESENSTEEQSQEAEEKKSKEQESTKETSKEGESPLDAVLKAIDEIKSILTEKKAGDKEKSDIDELKLAVKARDDEIEALNKKVEILTKSDEKKGSKTVQENEDESEELEIEPDDPFTVERGEVYLRY